MKILLIEDDELKAKQLNDFVIAEWKVEVSDFCIRQSLQSGLQSIMQETYDLLLLDMSMPIFGNPSGRHRGFAGLDILNEMKRKDRKIPTIVVTQYSIFGEGEDKKDAVQLDKLLKDNYSQMYIGMVYYNALARNWKENLVEMINSIIIKE